MNGVWLRDFLFRRSRYVIIRSKLAARKRLHGVYEKLSQSVQSAKRRRRRKKSILLTDLLECWLYKSKTGAFVSIYRNINLRASRVVFIFRKLSLFCKLSYVFPPFLRAKNNFSSRFSRETCPSNLQLKTRGSISAYLEIPFTSHATRHLFVLWMKIRKLRKIFFLLHHNVGGLCNKKNSNRPANSPPLVGVRWVECWARYPLMIS